MRNYHENLLRNLVEKNHHVNHYLNKMGDHPKSDQIHRDRLSDLMNLRSNVLLKEHVVRRYVEYMLLPFV